MYEVISHTVTLDTKLTYDQALTLYHASPCSKWFKQINYIKSDGTKFKVVFSS